MADPIVLLRRSRAAWCEQSWVNVPGPASPAALGTGAFTPGHVLSPSSHGSRLFASRREILPSFPNLLSLGADGGFPVPEDPCVEGMCILEPAC